ncbi:hypothetical protein A3Q56_05588 [Intoshia linei]|uniref:Uncharacterized protein n=1 Tax=Intoshia linei TaxID=1819745 RepID=A0A177AZT9_9BILA|nr:hypothetical protein A3Q56_05588 [Intoshia linei]
MNFHITFIFIVSTLSFLITVTNLHIYFNSGHSYVFNFVKKREITKPITKLEPLIIVPGFGFSKIYYKCNGIYDLCTSGKIWPFYAEKYYIKFLYASSVLETLLRLHYDKNDPIHAKDAAYAELFVNVNGYDADNVKYLDNKKKYCNNNYN